MEDKDMTTIFQTELFKGDIYVLFSNKNGAYYCCVGSPAGERTFEIPFVQQEIISAKREVLEEVKTHIKTQMEAKQLPEVILDQVCIILEREI